MKTLRFEWDPGKAMANLKKHGIPFQEALRFSMMSMQSSSMTTSIRNGKTVFCYLA